MASKPLLNATMPHKRASFVKTYPSLKHQLFTEGQVPISGVHVCPQGANDETASHK